MIYQMAQKRAGAGVPSPNRIMLLRDNGAGVATKTVFLKDLNSPFGMVLVGNDLYVPYRRCRSLPYTEGATQIDAPGVKVADLPAGPINHHWTKNVVASADGSKLYATVGSNSNAGENGLDKEETALQFSRLIGRPGAARLCVGSAQSQRHGLRAGDRYALDGRNERDELGSDLVPDYLTSVKDGGFYGWPYSYYGSHVDPRVPPNPDMVAKATVPDYGARKSRRRPRPCLLHRGRAAGAIPRRRVHRRARLLESKTAERLQGRLRLVRRRAPERTADRCPYWIPE